MAEPSTDGRRRSSRLVCAAAEYMSRRRIGTATTSQPARIYNHHHQQRDTDLVYADFDDLPYADEHPANADKLTLVFILNNSASTTDGTSASASALRPVNLVSGVRDHQQQQPHVSSTAAAFTRRAGVGSYSSDGRGRASMSTDELAGGNILRSWPRSDRVDYDSSPLAVSSMVQYVQMSSPASDRRSGDTTSTHGARVAAASTVEQSKLEKKRGRMCKTDGCENYIVHKRLCCRHGGGKQCTIEGCNTSAKHLGLCWKHGGSTECDIDGCTKRAKARHLCWAHGGGTKCVTAECEKVAVSGGFCWAHGGGKRCNFDNCNKPGYERTQNFCTKHHAEMQHVNYFEV